MDVVVEWGRLSRMGRCFEPRVKTDRVCGEQLGLRHALYFSCRMSRLERLICARMRWKRSSGGSAQDCVLAASFACARRVDLDEG